MGLLDIFKKKGLNPNQNVTTNIRSINGALLQEYENGKYVYEGYLGNADVYSIVSFLARKAASIPWYVYKTNNTEKGRTSLAKYKQLTKG
jgi:phage portal protein BeeE